MSTSPGSSCESSDGPRDVYETIASNRNSLDDYDRISRTLALEDSSVNVYHGYESTESEEHSKGAIKKRNKVKQNFKKLRKQRLIILVHILTLL